MEEKRVEQKAVQENLNRGKPGNRGVNYSQ